ncbi:acetyltransferase-like isoleucine patch superfamily enzyme [Spinactinospora alkalitolerans]|uniref:Acetyltransferase-like isoleucine patch superfamily enzyme n=1 Tax=Spinactinospora alkalitolerans TaxID=687207 RepID=A0A852U533_9ACTN|nr:DapH/DapD/GlmU-related protein [Spinactinospora alkalitolerans]NYE50717.1 acetyltransferase-like isoleucine patch superfamily enzyme [Spinactinospora alkalitolerans]
MNLDHLYGTVSMGQGSAVGEHCTLGYPKEARIRAFREDPATAEAGEPVGIGDRCMLFNQVIVYEGVSIADGCLVEDRVRIGYDSRVGPGSRIVYGAYICDRVSIGAEARIAGFVCDATRIGDRCTVMGDLVHEYTRPHVDWWDADEESPRVEDDSVVGYGARVVGGIRIGPRSYVAAGAVVTRDVPPEHIATGVNTLTPIRDWTGTRLRALIEHWTSPRPPAASR